MRDIRDLVGADLVGLNARVEDVFRQVILIATSQNTMVLNGVSSNSLMPASLMDILSFIQISEYNALKAGNYPDDLAKITVFTKDIANSFIKFSTMPKTDVKLFNLLTALFLLFPSFMFEYLAFNLYNKDYDYYMSETQVTHRAPGYRTVNTMP
jgi:hypothetical protein